MQQQLHAYPTARWLWQAVIVLHVISLQDADLTQLKRTTPYRTDSCSMLRCCLCCCYAVARHTLLEATVQSTRS
jgi:hypothetical protein